MDYAEDLLSYFVHKSKELYSEYFIVYNVHNLLHLTDDARHFNREKHLQSIKRMVRNLKIPIAQVTNRLIERELCKVKNYPQSSTLTYISTSIFAKK